jgi:hypothetical protein
MALFRVQNLDTIMMIIVGYIAYIVRVISMSVVKKKAGRSELSRIFQT